MKKAGYGLARLQVALIIIVLAVSAGVGAYALTMQGSSGNEVQLQIIETDPANQIDSFIPPNVTAKQGTPLTFVVHNGDDEDRLFTIAAFNFNMTISPHTALRGTFTPDRTGTFVMYSPQTKPSAASNGKPGTPCTGYLTVTP
jgi:heme/copper-type cytochrome/quinol oxidase subunit 2